MVAQELEWRAELGRLLLLRGRMSHRSVGAAPMQPVALSLRLATHEFRKRRPLSQSKTSRFSSRLAGHIVLFQELSGHSNVPRASLLQKKAPKPLKMLAQRPTAPPSPPAPGRGS